MAPKSHVKSTELNWLWCVKGTILHFSKFKKAELHGPKCTQNIWWDAKINLWKYYAWMYFHLVLQKVKIWIIPYIWLLCQNYCCKNNKYNFHRYLPRECVNIIISAFLDVFLDVFSSIWTEFNRYGSLVLEFTNHSTTIILTYGFSPVLHWVRETTFILSFYCLICTNLCLY